jgi:hypothetical protein
MYLEIIELWQIWTASLPVRVVPVMISVSSLKEYQGIIKQI